MILILFIFFAARNLFRCDFYTQTGDERDTIEKAR